MSREDVRKVQNLIERCLQLYMNQKEVIDTLSLEAKIEPSFTELERSPPIEEVIQSGVVPRFVQFFTREDFPNSRVLIQEMKHCLPRALKEVV
ncbi:hypothetical protein ZWY2020_028494 [Hordeum vulgare]|nr:hypothetical protein ZWY2020_028494 [Hordeum vulgare]